jgi:hypothetical protein
VEAGARVARDDRMQSLSTIGSRSPRSRSIASPTGRIQLCEDGFARLSNQLPERLARNLEAEHHYRGLLFSNPVGRGWCFMDEALTKHCAGRAGLLAASAEPLNAYMITNTPIKSHASLHRQHMSWKPVNDAPTTRGSNQENARSS